MARGSAVTYPSSPPPAIPPQLPGQNSHLIVDSTDLPPIPSTVTRSRPAPDFQEMGNPWADDSSTQTEQVHNIPAFLKPGSHQEPASSNHSLRNVPEILRPGWSGEATPRSSSESNRSPEREWWDDDDVDDHTTSDKKNTQPSRSAERLQVLKDPIPVSPSSHIKRKPLPQVSPQAQQKSPAGFGSNNPFRPASDTHIESTANMPYTAADGMPLSKSNHPNPLRSHPSTDQLGRLTLNSSGSSEPNLTNTPSLAPPPPQHAPPPPPPPSIPEMPSTTPQTSKKLLDESSNPWVSIPSEEAPPLPPPDSLPLPTEHQTMPTNHLSDSEQYHQHNHLVAPGHKLEVVPTAAPHVPLNYEDNLLDDEPGPSLPPRPNRTDTQETFASASSSPMGMQPPMKPPRPAVITSEPDLARMREQRNETYSIKHFNWVDPRSSRMRRSSMLVQNKNGPCPLLALVNALILGATEDMQAALDDALRLREQVTLGLIIETLVDELITRASTIGALVVPDVDELNRFLMRLRTGMNANPRFVPQRLQAPNLIDADSPISSGPSQQPFHGAGTFENTQDIQLYSSFKVKLIHGWLPRPNDQAAQAFARSAQTYEDAQAIQFGEEELEYKLSSGGLSQIEQQVWEDINSIKQFLQAYPTQLTPYGLSAVHAALEPGEFAILFRNDHFSTIYKHPRDQQLYTLITDAGYADRDEIIWETLEDINGARSEFFSGDFNSVSHGDTSHAMPHSQTPAANPQRYQQPQTANGGLDGVLAMDLRAQEQHDADFAMALQLQEEEEQAMRRQRNQQNQPNPPNQPGPPAGPGGRGGEPNHRGRRPPGNIPIPLRGHRNPDSAENRPLIPPRNSQNRNPATNRPSDANNQDAPPAYEEAARTSPYVPPIGSPLHPSSSTDLSGRGGPSTSLTNVHAQGQTTGVTGSNTAISDRPTMGRMPGQFMQHRRRASAYGENSEGWQQSHIPDHTRSAFGPSYAFMRSPDTERRPSGRGVLDRDRECTVM